MRKNEIFLFTLLLLVGLQPLYLIFQIEPYSKEEIDLNLKSYSTVENKLMVKNPNTNIIGNPISSQIENDSIILWNKTFNSINGSSNNAMWVDTDYIYTTGTINLDDSFSPKQNILLIKWDKDGNQIWNRSWGGILTDRSNAILGDETNIYVHGYTYNHGGNDKFILIKWDKDGNQIWNKSWGYPGRQYNYFNSMASDGTYLYTNGHSQKYGEYFQIAVIKWDKEGNQIWNRTWGEEKAENSNSIWCSQEGIYVSGGRYGYENSSLNGKVLVKWDFDGNQIWNRTWKYGEILSLWDDGEFVYGVGYNGFLSSRDSNANLILMKWDFYGNLFLNKTVNNDVTTCGTFITGDSSNLYITGFSENKSMEMRDILLLIYNLKDKLLFNWTWGGKMYEFGYSVSFDNNYIYLTGLTGIGLPSSGNTSFNSILMKLQNPLNDTFTIPFSGITMILTVSLVSISIIITKITKKKDKSTRYNLDSAN